MASCIFHNKYYLQFDFAGLKNPILVVDKHLKVSTFVVNNDVFSILIMDYFIRLNTRYPCCVE